MLGKMDIYAKRDKNAVFLACLARQNALKINLFASLLVFFSTSYPGFANHLSFIADSDTIFLGAAKRVGSEFNMSEVNAAASMLSDGELLDLISIRSDAFRKIANATRLRGYLGSQNFEITYKMRSSWRLLFEYSMLETIRAN